MIRNHRRLVAALPVAAAVLALHAAPAHAQTQASGDSADPLERVRVNEDGLGFVRGDPGREFVPWGVNYDRDDNGRLLEDYWVDEWDKVAQDFAEIKALGANVVRVHLQLAAFMKGPDEPNRASLARLEKLVRLAEENRLYLDVTGLGCYHRQDVPPWYDKLPEVERWEVQSRFWRHVAAACQGRPAIFCYDLMNEPVLPGDKPETDWLAGELAGKHYVQRISLELAGRAREEVAAAWVKQLAAAIRAEDPESLVTVGVIPWALVFERAQPLFYSPAVRGPLDFASVHFYPKSGQLDRALAALQKYDVGKPLVIEEMFPLGCSVEELEEFIDRSNPPADGWISFYWGATIEENRQKGDIAGALTAAWLEAFRGRAERMNPENEPR